MAAQTPAPEQFPEPIRAARNKNRIPDAAGVERAAEKIAKILPPTPLLPVEIHGVTIWCKAECLQPIGAFKIRGGWHRLSDLTPEEKARGVVAFSSGNHAQGVAWAAKRLGMASTIVMPADAPNAKMNNTRALGAEIVTYDRMSGNREELAEQLCAETGATLVPSFDDPWIIEGQGSAGVEIREQMRVQTGELPSAILVCCGGGGLSSGIALANPQAAITVVEPEGWDDMAQSLASGRVVPVGPNPPPTSCDALQTLRVSSLTRDILAAHGAHGAQAAQVSENEVAAAMKFAMERLHLVVEPGGAVALAAVLAGKVEPEPHMAVTLSGGNVDSASFLRMIA